MSDDAKPSIGDVRTRLDEIYAAVSDESIELDEALNLYEEAVALGLAACELSADELTLDEESPSTGAEKEDASNAAPDESKADSQG